MSSTLKNNYKNLNAYYVKLCSHATDPRGHLNLGGGNK